MNKTSKASQHTKGPWEISDSSVWGVSPLNARVRLADIRKHASMNGIDSEANARLIAAAPDLLNLCKDAKDLIYRCPSLRQAPEVEQFLNALLQAIAKAEGRDK